VLGLYVSEHPLQGHPRSVCAARRTARSASSSVRRDGEVITIRRHRPRRCGNMTTEAPADANGSSCRVEDVTRRYRDGRPSTRSTKKARRVMQRPTGVLIVKGRIDRKEGRERRSSRSEPLGRSSQCRRKREVRLKIDATKSPPRGTIHELRRLIEDFPGESGRSTAEF